MDQDLGSRSLQCGLGNRGTGNERVIGTPNFARGRHHIYIHPAKRPGRTVGIRVTRACAGVYTLPQHQRQRGRAARHGARARFCGSWGVPGVGCRDTQGNPVTGVIRGERSGRRQIAQRSRRRGLTIGMHTPNRRSHDGTVLGRNAGQAEWSTLVEETRVRIISQTYGPMTPSGRGDPASQSLPEAHQCCYPLTRGFRRGRPDKGLGLTASRLLQSWATGDRRKLPMPPKRKLLQTAHPQGDEAVEAICAVIRRIPKGWVATYGQVAAMAGMPRRARLVGRVLQRLDPATKIPWHRVVNAKGEVSYSLSRNGGDILQRRLLEKEGIKFDDSNRLDLERCRWRD